MLGRPGMRVTASLLLLLAVSRSAAALEPVLLPAGPLAADGVTVHRLKLYLVEGDRLVAGVPTVHATRGAIVGAPALEPDGGIGISYRPPRVSAPGDDVLSVAARGTLTRVEVALEPVGRLQLTVAVSPTPLVLGRDATAEVRVTVRDAAGRPARAPLRLGTSVGRVSAPIESAPGEYRAVYTPPDDRFPQVAIVAARSVADGAFAAAACRLFARVTLEGRGEPGAAMRITVDGKTYGPVSIGGDGRFALPLIVPPGGRAVGNTVDKLGNQQRREVDLALPPFPRLLIAVVPPELPADGRAQAEVVVFAVDGRGNPERRAAPPLTVDRGTLAPPEVRGDGAATWRYTAPAELGGGAVTLRGGGVTRTLPLHPGPPARVEVVPPAAPLGAGLDIAQPIEVRVVDAQGAPVGGARLEAQLAGGRVLGARELGVGAYQLDVVPSHDLGRSTARLHVEVTGQAPGPPRRLTLHALPARDDRLVAEAWVDDDLGVPVPGVSVELTADGARAEGVSDRFGTARLELPRPAGRRRARLVARALALPGVEAALDLLFVGGTTRAVSSVIGQGRVSAGDGPLATPSVEATLPLRPAAPVDVTLHAEPAHPRAGEPTRLRVELRDAQGRPADRRIVYQASGGQLALVRAPSGGRAELEFTPPADARPGSRYLLSVTETSTRVTAFTEIVTR
jgi:hypothetical protein